MSSKMYEMSIQRLEDPTPSRNEVRQYLINQTDEDPALDFVINFHGLMREYGGAMNSSFMDAATRVQKIGVKAKIRSCLHVALIHSMALLNFVTENGLFD